MVKIRTPAGAERQGHLCCSRAGPGQADRRHGEGGAVIQAQSLRNASRDSPAIPEAAAHLSGMRCSELLTTSSNWTIFSYLSGSQLHWLQRASVRTEKAQDKESLQLVFLASFYHSISLFLSEAINPSICQFSACSCHISVLGVLPGFSAGSVRGDQGFVALFLRYLWRRGCNLVWV